MKCFPKELSLSGAKLLVLFLGILTGCVQATPLAAAQTSTIVYVPTKTALLWAPFVPSKIKLADLPPGCGDAQTWSPDLKWAVDLCGPNSDVVVWKIGEQQTTPLLSKAIAPGYSATFSPDGKKLLVAVTRGPLLLFDVGQWQTPKTLYPKLPTYAFPTWAPDSQSFAISYLEEGQALSIMKLDGTYENLLALHDVNTNYADYGVNMFGPAWSPDGSEIAYTIAREMFDRHPVQLWTVEVATGKRNLLYSGKPGEEAYEPEWSPDGSKILVINEMSATSSDDNKMYIYDVDKKTFSVLSSVRNPFDPTWSPDSQHLAVCDNLGKLYVISFVTGETELVSPVCGIVQWRDNNNIALEYLDSLYLLSIKISINGTN